MVIIQHLEIKLKALILTIFLTSSGALLAQNDRLDRQDLMQQKVLFDALKERDLGNYPEAAELFTRVLGMNPDLAVANYELARMLIISNQTIKGLPFAEKAVSLDASNVYYLELLADFYTSSLKWEEALGVFDQLIAFNAQKPNYYLAKATVLQQLGKNKKAFDVLDELEEKFGSTTALWMQRIEMALSDKKSKLSKRLEKAEEIALEALKKLENDPNVLSRLGDIYEMTDQPEKAIQVFLNLRDEIPNSGQLSFLLSKLYLQVKDEASAHKYLKEAFGSNQVDTDEKLGILIQFFRVGNLNDPTKKRVKELIDIFLATHPDDPKPYTIQGDFLNLEGKYEEAEVAYRKSVSLDPSKHLVWRQLIVVNSFLGKDSAILSNTKKAIELFPDLSVFFLFRGQALMNAERYTEAAEVLEEGVLLSAYSDTEQAEFYFYLGSVYHEMEEHKRSDSAFDRSLDLFPDNPFLLNNYSYYLALRGVNLEKAERMSRRSNELDPNRSSFCDTYGYILFLNGKMEESIKWYQKAIELGADQSSEVLEHYADALAAIGKAKEAKEIWIKALELDPGNQILIKKIEK